MELSIRLLEVLRRDPEFIFSRGLIGDGSPVLVLSPAAEYPRPESLEHLEHEYSFREELDASWAARPFALDRQSENIRLLLEDPGGTPLVQLLDDRSDLVVLLRLAIGLCGAIDHLHRRGIIHKDIKPANVLADPVTGRCWLTGFGIASRLPRERQSIDPPEFIAGTLAYMAPEQTGRMNRSIDSRSDLYALGVTLYEMLTGSLPFTASDPMEWVHCHIARTPMPPSQRSNNIPLAVSAIIMKLLAKTAEDRYQTAAGVESDLRRVLAEWENERRVSEFPLGERDASDRLLVPEKLYGRSREIDTLLACFSRVAVSGRPELVLVSGYSGIGKSSVVNELHKVLVLPRGLFASGKFDQYQRNIPYATLAQAFQSLIRSLLGKNEAELQSWRNALREALGPNGQLIIDLVPELKLIIGEQPSVANLPPQDAQGRFQIVFRRFIGVFARQEHPLALFLDDLQWLDLATLDLIEHLLTQSDVQHLMLIGAYRDNEVSSSHPLMRRLEAIRQAGATVNEIILPTLSREDLSWLISDAIGGKPEQVTPLAQLIQEKTAGNPFFAIQFLATLSEEGLLTFDYASRSWSWELDRIQAKGYTENVVELMVGKLTRLPIATQKALQELASLGNSAGFHTLSLVCEKPEKKIHSDLWEAVRLEFIQRLKNSYKFVHDRVQEAAYVLIPEGERPAIHHKIATTLVSRTTPEEMEEKIFEIVNQFNRGAALIDSQPEREQVAELNLAAGERAKSSTAFAAALTYFAAGSSLLYPDSWEKQYRLVFSLELQRAECEFLIGDFVAAEERLTMLSHRAPDLVDSAGVARLQTELYTALDKIDRAVEAASDYLRRAGVELAPHPTDEQVQQEYDGIWQQLGDRPIEALIDLPPMTDSACRATLDVLTAVEEPVHYIDQNLQCLVIARIVNLSLVHGNSDGSCVAYVQLGWLPLQFVRALRGLTLSLASFSDAEFDEGKFEQYLEANPHPVFAGCWYWIRKLQAHFYACDYAAALEAGAKAEPLMQPGSGHFESPEYVFYDALARAAHYDSASPEERLRDRGMLTAHHDLLLIWAKNCPENFENRAALVAGEIARIEGRDIEAMRLYQQAILLAQENNFIQNEAIAYEVAARFYAGRGFEKIAHTYLREARYCYLCWGASGKVRQLDEQYLQVGTEDSSLRGARSIETPVEHLDLATVVKVSQAVSGEIVLEKLIDTLMRSAIEYAGAERGLLVLSRGVDLQIAAEATTRADRVTVHLTEAVTTETTSPESILHYVVRTQESVILDDAEAQNPFSDDGYIRQHRARSILCLPLVNQAKLIGVLYLENSLTSHVFTPRRIAVLKLLASQAAISLENTRLYRDLEEARAELANVTRVAVLGELTASIAHEINQPLTAIVSNGSACLRWLAAENLEEARQAASRAVAAGHRAGEIIGRIRALAKKAPPQKDWLDLNETIDEVIAMAWNEVQSHRVSLQTQLADDLPAIRGDKIQLQQVTLNLLVNAVEAMNGLSHSHREIWIVSKKIKVTSHIRADVPVDDETSSEAPWTHLLVAVRDSGPGVDPDNLGRIFDAFYTTKSQGLGMGLAICRSIIEAHGGKLWTSPNTPRGAVFQFTLPIRD